MPVRPKIVIAVFTFALAVAGCGTGGDEGADPTSTAGSEVPTTITTTTVATTTDDESDETSGTTVDDPDDPGAIVEALALPQGSSSKARPPSCASREPRW